MAKKKNDQTNVDSIASAAREVFNAAAETHRVALAALQADTEASKADPKAHKNALLAQLNRIKRNETFSKMLDNPKFAETFARYGLTAQRVQGLQIYAQDKMLQTLQAIASGCALSALHGGNHSNQMTQRLIAAIDKNGTLNISTAPIRMHDLFPDKSVGTYSAQASSSRQVLDTLGLLAIDGLTGAFKLNDKGEEVRNIIAC